MTDRTPTSKPTSEVASWVEIISSRISRLWKQLRRRWWLVFGSVALMISLAAILLWRAEPTFRSYGKMIFNQQLSIPGVTTPDGASSREMENYIGTQMDLMQSGVVIVDARKRVKEAFPDLDPCEVVPRVYQSRNTMLHVQVTGTKPGYTQAFLNAWMEAFLHYFGEQQTQSSQATYSAVTSELNRLENEIQEAENDLIKFQRENNIVFLEEQGSSAGRYLAELNTQLASLRKDYQLLEILNLDQNIERMKRQDGEAPTVVAPTTGNLGTAGNIGSLFSQAKQQIQILEAELEDWSQYMKPKHPKIIGIKEEIARQTKLLEVYRQQSQLSIAEERKAIELRIQNLEALIAEWEVKSLDASQRMADYQRIRGRMERSQELYNRLLNTLQSVDISQNLNREPIAILERASDPSPLRPNLLLSLIGAAVGGILIGLSAIFVLDRLDDSPNSMADMIEMFDEVVLAEIPLVASATEEESLLIRDDDTRPVFSESWRNLRSGLLFMPHAHQDRRILMVTSAIPGEGKSTVAANLAIILAQGGSRVLLVDADLRRGVLHKRFALSDNLQGLSDVMKQQTPWREAVKETGIPNLSIIPRGRSVLHPGELFLKPVTDLFLRESSEEYDILLLDTTPVMVIDDAANLAPKTDDVLFVVRANYTSSRLANTALSHLYMRQANVLGIIFNSVDINQGGYQYYRYSGYYSSDED